MTSKLAAEPPIEAVTKHNVAVALQGVRKTFDGAVALERIDLEVYEGEFISLLGPSGCGKTTLLRLIAGFEEPDAGAVLIGGKDASKLPPHKRPVNTVFQSYALFPHMDVESNVMFGLKMAGVPKREAKARAFEAMKLVEIDDFAKRKPSQLSGGQRQRVALARAIVNEPEVLLLDEPLGALDLKLRKQLQIELMQLQRRVGITFIYVTHDQEEALVMSDRIAVMREGLIEQLGGIDETYERPRTRFVASFLGSANLLEGRVKRLDANEAMVETAHGPLLVSTDVRGAALTEGRSVTLAVRPEKIDLIRNASAGENVLRGVVEELIYTGVETQYLVRVGEGVLSVYLMNKTLHDSELFDRGDEVSLVIPAGSLVALDD